MVRPHLSPILKTVRAELYYSIPGSVAINTYYFLTGNTWSHDSLLLCASALRDWEQSDAHKYRSNQVYLTSVRVTDLTNLEAYRLTLTPTSFVPGSLGSDILPQNVSLAVTLVTGKRGSGRQGRSYWIGLASEQVDGDQINVDALTSILNTMDVLRTLLIPSCDAALVVPHRVVDGVRLATGTVDFVLGVAVSDLTIDSQVNRLPGRSRPSHRS